MVAAHCNGKKLCNSHSNAQPSALNALQGACIVSSLTRMRHFIAFLPESVTTMWLLQVFLLHHDGRPSEQKMKIEIPWHRPRSDVQARAWLGWRMLA